MKVCIGGTFSILHVGHKRLIDKAFEVAGAKGLVFIGITSDKFVQDKKKVKSFSERKKSLEKYLSEKGYMSKSVIKTISDKYGPTLEVDFDAIVVSPETMKNAAEINVRRLVLGRKPLKIIKIPFVLAYDGKPISSSRIKNDEIDENGKILKRD